MDEPVEVEAADDSEIGVVDDALSTDEACDEEEVKSVDEEAEVSANDVTDEACSSVRMADSCGAISCARIGGTDN